MHERTTSKELVLHFKLTLRNNGEKVTGLLSNHIKFCFSKRSVCCKDSALFNVIFMESNNFQGI